MVVVGAWLGVGGFTLLVAGDCREKSMHKHIFLLCNYALLWQFTFGGIFCKEWCTEACESLNGNVEEECGACDPAKYRCNSRSASATSSHPQAVSQAANDPAPSGASFAGVLPEDDLAPAKPRAASPQWRDVPYFTYREATVDGGTRDYPPVQEGGAVPYRCSHVFEVNDIDRLALSEIRVDGFRALRVDNVYARPDELRQLLLRHPTSMWKGGSHPDETRNFKDYYDCRTSIYCGAASNGVPPIHGLFLRLVRDYFNVSERLSTTIESAGACAFNLFRFSRARRRQLDGVLEQSFPHMDTPEAAPHPRTLGAFAAVLYLNTEEESSGGTRFYSGEFDVPPDHIVFQKEEDADPEAFDTLVDTSRQRVLAQVPMRYNSMIIYRGNVTHGAWFDDESDAKFGDSGTYPGSQWRISQVIFSEGGR